MLKINVLKLVKLILKLGFIVLLSAIFWWLNAHKILPNNVLLSLIVCVAILKVGYLLHATYRKIMETVTKNIAFHHFLLFILANMILAICSFAADFWNSYVINPQSFVAISANFNTYETMFEFVYFSTLTFSFFGYGEIMPQIVATKLLVMMEVSLAFLNMIFVLADFVGLKESLRKEI